MQPITPGRGFGKTTYFIKHFMENFQQLSRSEMKNVLGGYAQIQCSITVLGNDGFTETGACASTDMESCFSYTETKAGIYNQENGYPGASYECHYAGGNPS